MHRTTSPVKHWLMIIALPYVLPFALGNAHAEATEAPAPYPVVEEPCPQLEPIKAPAAQQEQWIDRAQLILHQAISRSSMRIDRLFGSRVHQSAYDEVTGSIAPALLWDELDGFRPKLRFRINLPLPHLDERFNAFIGRVNPDEYVTERSRESGAFPQQQGPIEDDQTLFGIRYREPRLGQGFEADAGMRVRSPLDPYVKGSYRFARGQPDRLVFSLRETVFWQNSEKFGLTSRVDVEKIFDERWLVRATGSGTLSQETAGVRGYAALMALRGFPGRRAVAAELFTSGEFDAPVALENYGVKVAYRKSVIRDWLILEVRTSVTWPKEVPIHPRKPSWGLGIGFEMLFGTQEFWARPVTF